IAARMEPFEEKLRQAIREEVERASAMASSELEARMESRDRKMLEMVLAVGQACLDTADRLSPPARGGSGLSAAAVQAAGGIPLPSFARPVPPKGIFRTPFVSSFFAVTCGLLAL